ncbi:MAG: hypothetical protein HXO22_02185 [Prevotella sp.]|jgi:hypothetical protein|nr:hypothetical protein [Prevotella sp.]MBF1584562.1 hypothetical protein [Prevotella sp.]
MKDLRQTSHKRTSTSVLFSQRPTLKTGILSALGLMPRQRFADYLKGNDIDDFRRDASMIAEDMNKIINDLTHGRKRTR